MIVGELFTTTMAEVFCDNILMGRSRMFCECLVWLAAGIQTINYNITASVPTRILGQVISTHWPPRNIGKCLCCELLIGQTGKTVTIFNVLSTCNSCFRSSVWAYPLIVETYYGPEMLGVIFHSILLFLNIAVKQAENMPFPVTI